MAAALAASAYSSGEEPGSHPQRADSQSFGGERRGPGTGGRAVGTNGVVLFRVCIGLILIGAVICAVNALSILDDAVREGKAIVRWQPWATEYTSLAGLIAGLPIAIAAERFAAGARGLASRVTVAILASMPFSLVHLGAMVALRELLWRVLGRSYGFDFGQDWLYEYRKDAIAYGVALLVLTLARRLGSAPASSGAGKETGRPLVHMADGRREVMVDVSSLRAVRGGGNYIELIFADGRRRLLRSTLDCAGAMLAAHDFRRTHKSWLVRLGSVTHLDRTAAGDFRLGLDPALEAPLSRRNRALLDEIRDRLAGDPPAPLAVDEQ
jgi:hypothetical protein